MSRLMAAVASVKKLIDAVLDGDPLAALELAQIYKAESVTELVLVVCPLEGPSAKAFDACADGFALKKWKETA